MIYLSGGMHSGWQDKIKAAFPRNVYLDPREHGLENPADYTETDMEMIEISDSVIACLETGNPSGLGLAFEIGYAIGLGIPVFFIDESEDRYTEILRCASDDVFSSIEEFIEDFPKLIHATSKQFKKPKF